MRTITLVSFSADLRSASQRCNCLLSVGRALSPTFCWTENRTPPHRPLGRTHFLLGIFFLPTQQSLLLCQAGSPATTAVSCASVRRLSSCRITAWFHCLNPPQGFDLCRVILRPPAVTVASVSLVCFCCLPLPGAFLCPSLLVFESACG